MTVMPAQKALERPSRVVSVRLPARPPTLPGPLSATAAGPWPLALIERMRLAPARSRRIALIILACALMGLADLACTLTYMSGVGMIEKNPLARMIAHHGGPSHLIIFKMLTLMLHAYCLWIIRRHERAEQCGWLCIGILGALTIHWMNYNDVMTEQGIAVASIASMSPELLPDHWVCFAPME
jgi:hypothetical protein